MFLTNLGLILVYVIVSLFVVTSNGLGHFNRAEYWKQLTLDTRRIFGREEEPIKWSHEYQYNIVLTWILIPFKMLTKNNKYYFVRLIGYLLNIAYGGYGLFIYVFVLLTYWIARFLSGMTYLLYTEIKDL